MSEPSPTSILCNCEQRSLWRVSACAKTMRGSRKFCQRGPNFDRVFFLFFINKGRGDPNTTIKGAIIGPPANANNDQKVNAGLVALWFFRGSRPILLRHPIFL